MDSSLAASANDAQACPPATTSAWTPFRFIRLKGQPRPDCAKRSLSNLVFNAVRYTGEAEIASLLGPTDRGCLSVPGHQYIGVDLTCRA